MIATSEGKQCSRCKETFPLESFQRNRAMSDGLQNHCRNCRLEYDRANRERNRARRNEQSRRWHKANHERAENKRLKWRYGIEKTDYDRLYAEQNGCCAICGVSFAAERPRVDHDHATGQVRGLLCNGCNVGIGALGESPDRLKQAIAYLKRF